MEKRVIIIACFCLALNLAQAQSLTIDDLVSLATLSPQHYDDNIVKKGFPIKRRNIIDNITGFTFRANKNKDDSLATLRSIDLYKKNDTWCIAYHTTSLEEFTKGHAQLQKMCSSVKALSDTSCKSPFLFQKKTITIQPVTGWERDDDIYTFLVTRKEIPDRSNVRFADDLVRFDSHEYLVSCFGEANVKKDTYLFADNESKKCSVLFPNTDEQAVFIWDDEVNYRKISYILISGTISTPGAKEYTASISHNKWELKNGIYPGMRLSDLLRLNSNDFKFYGNQSEYSMMVEPKITGSINFKWIGIGFNCFNCDRSVVLDKQKVSASDAVNSNLAMHVSCIMITP
jgi:hypothetical protein